MLKYRPVTRYMEMSTGNNLIGYVATAHVQSSLRPLILKCNTLLFHWLWTRSFADRQRYLSQKLSVARSVSPTYIPRKSGSGSRQGSVKLTCISSG